MQLIVQAGAIGESGDVFVLDMGEPVKIVDLAHNMIRLSGKEPERDIAIEFIGVRPGEKLHEELWGEGEDSIPTAHPKILRCRLRARRPGWLDDELAELDRLVEAGETVEVVARLGEMMRSPHRLAEEGGRGRGHGPDRSRDAVLQLPDRDERDLGHLRVTATPRSCCAPDLDLGRRIC